MELTIKLRRDISSTWTSVNPILADGEMGIETDTKKFKFGNGIDPWNLLDYASTVPNTPITGGTHTKITYDSKGLVTAGEDLSASDIPDITLSKISDITATPEELNVLDGITASTEELNYVDGVTSNIQTQLNNKQPTGNYVTTDTAQDITATKTFKTTSSWNDGLVAERNTSGGSYVAIKNSTGLLGGIGLDALKRPSILDSTGSNLNVLVRCGNYANPEVGDTSTPVYVDTNGIAKACTNVVNTNAAQDITATKTFKAQQKIQSGSTAGALLIGGDVNATTLTNGTRKIGRINLPPKNTADPNVGIIFADNYTASAITVLPEGYTTDNSNSISLGGIAGDTTGTSPDVLAFTVATEHNATAANKKVIALEISKEQAKFNVKPNYNGNDLISLSDLTGAISNITTNNLTPLRAVVSDSNGKLVASSNITATEMSYLDGVTSNIQTQLDNKVSNSFTELRAIVSNSEGKLVASSNITATEMSYLNGVTSNIQTQLDNKVAKTASANKIYGTSTANTETTLDYSTSNTASSIVQRDSNSQVNVNLTPTDNTHASSKKYVDDRITAAISEAVVFKGVVADQTQLPQSDNTNGDMYWITAFVAPAPTGMTAGRSGAAIYKVTGTVGEWNYTEDAIYQPDEQTIDLNGNGKLYVKLSSNANNSISAQNDGLFVDISGKVDANASITGATKCKITYDNKGLVTSGADLTASDIPDLSLSKITDVTASASELNVLDGITATTTELNYVDGVTSNIQTQLDNKVSNNFTTLRAIVSNSEGKLVASSNITATEMSYLDGVTSNIQTQLNSKINDVQVNGASVVSSGTATIPLASDSSYGVTKATIMRIWTE